MGKRLIAGDAGTDTAPESALGCNLHAGCFDKCHVEDANRLWMFVPLRWVKIPRLRNSVSFLCLKIKP